MIESTDDQEELRTLVSDLLLGSYVSIPGEQSSLSIISGIFFDQLTVQFWHNSQNSVDLLQICELCPWMNLGSKHSETVSTGISTAGPHVTSGYAQRRKEDMASLLCFLLVCGFLIGLKHELTQNKCSPVLESCRFLPGSLQEAAACRCAGSWGCTGRCPHPCQWSSVASDCPARWALHHWTVDQSCGDQHESESVCSFSAVQRSKVNNNNEADDVSVFQVLVLSCVSRSDPVEPNLKLRNRFRRS